MAVWTSVRASGKRTRGKPCRLWSSSWLKSFKHTMRSWVLVPDYRRQECLSISLSIWWSLAKQQLSLWRQPAIKFLCTVHYRTCSTKRWEGWTTIHLVRQLDLFQVFVTEISHPLIWLRTRLRYLTASNGQDINEHFFLKPVCMMASDSWELICTFLIPQWFPGFSVDVNDSQKLSNLYQDERVVSATDRSGIKPVDKQGRKIGWLCQ